MVRLPLPLAAVAAFLFPLLALALPPALPPPSPGAPDPIADRFAAATAALSRDRRGPEGIADLAALGALEDDLSDLGRLAAAYERAADDPGSHSEVRALARFQLAGLERSRGNLLRAEAHLRRLGFVSGWQVMGPFDDEGKRGHGAVFAPEQGIDAGARVPGKEREVAWRPLPRDAESGGLVHLGATVRPNREVVAYALTVVVAARDERVRLWFGGSGAARVWVNGAIAVDDPTYHAARLDQRGAAVSLRKGPNRILVKLCQQGGPMGFTLRLADERGEGRSFPGGDPFAPAPAPGPAPAPIEDALAVLARRAAEARGRAAPDAHATLSAVIATRAAGDRDDRRAALEAARAAALAPRSVDAQLAAAALEEDGARRRAILDAALRASPGDARLLRALAGEELDQNRPQAAALLLERAVAAAPGWAAPRVALAEALERAGLAVRAALFAEETARQFPTSPAAVRAAALAAVRLGRVEDAIRRERTLLALRFDDVQARGSLVGHLLDRGDLAGAVALLQEAIRVSPFELPLHLHLADLLAANGRPDAAEEAFARALELCPEEADTWERRGRARLLAGRAREAKEDLSRALALRPQNVALKELVRSLTPDQERFWKPYQLDARALAAAAPAAAPEEDAVVLGELHVTRVLPSGLSSTYTHRIVKVLTARGADAFRRQQLAWSPDWQEVRVERALVLKPDGRVVESHDENVESTSEPWYRLYYDVLARTLSFPALAPGDVLEVAWRIDDTASENLLSDYFGDLTFLDEPWRKLRFDYVLLLPESRAIHANEPPGVEHAVRSLPGGVKEHRYTARDSARIAPEPGMPGWSEVARTLHLSTYATWEEVNQFYWRLVRDQLRPTAEIRAVAQHLAEQVRERSPARPPARTPSTRAAAPTAVSFPAPTDREARAALVRATYDFVVSQTRYVGLEFGIHGYKPYRVDQVLSSAASATARTRPRCSTRCSRRWASTPAGAPAHAAAGAHPRAPGLAGRVQPRHRVRARARPLARRHRRVLRHPRPPRRGPRRHGPGREPGRSAPLRHHSRGGPRREPARGAARPEPGSRRERGGGRALARLGRGSPRVPALLRRGRRAPRAPGGVHGPALPRRAGGIGGHLGPGPHRGRRGHPVHAGRTPLRPARRRGAAVHPLRRQHRLRRGVRLALGTPAAARPGRSARDGVPLPLRASSRVARPRAARGGTGRRPAGRVRGPVPGRERRGHCGGSRVPPGAPGERRRVPGFPGPHGQGGPRLRAPRPHRTGAGCRQGGAVTTMSPRRAVLALVLAAAGCASPRAARAPGVPAEASDPGLPAARPPRAGDAWGSLAQAVRARRLLDGAAEVDALLSAAEAGTSGPVAVVALRRLTELAEESPARAAQVDAGMARLLVGGRLAGVAAYRARVARALCAEAVGDPSGAARYRRENGAVDVWTVIGPFSELRVLDFDRPIPPEAGEIPLEVPAPAGLPPSRTRSIPAPDGTFALDGEPPTGDVFALASDVNLARGGAYLLSLSTGASVRLLVDGAPVHERRAFAAWLPVIVHLPVELGPGRHRLVVKLARTDGNGALSVSLSRADGAASDAVWTAPAPGTPPPPPSGRPVRPSPVATSRQLADAMAGGAGPVLARLLAARDAMASDRESAKALVSEALALAPGSASALVALADTRDDDPTLDRRVAHSRAEAALRDALRADPGHAEARVMLARLLRAAERFDDADEILSALAAPAATRPQALAARGRAAEARGLPERAEALAAEALTAGGSCDAAELAASLAVRRQALARIEETSTLLARCRGGRERLAQQLRQRGDPAGAGAALDPLVAARPWDVDLGLSRAEAQVAEGQPAAAVRRMAALAAIWPRSPRIQVALAGALELSGDRAGARGARERALLLDGGDLSLRRALALEDGREALDDLSLDARAAIREYEAAGRRNGVSSVMVLDAAAVDIHPGGVATERTQQVIQVLDQAGVDQHGELSIPAGAEVIAARTLKPDGRAIEPERSGGEKGTLSLAGLEPGDYLQVDYIRAVRAPFGALGYAADPFFFAAPRERLFRSTYVVRAPDGAGLAADAHGMPSPPIVREGAFEVMRAERRDAPPFMPEPDAPGMSEVLPFVAVGTGASRETLQRSIADRLVGRTLRTEELAAFARQIRAESRDPSPLGLARAAYARVARTVLGDGPVVEDASQVLSRGRGNRLVVLRAVLQELGLEARVAVVRPFAADPSLPPLSHAGALRRPGAARPRRGRRGLARPVGPHEPVRRDPGVARRLRGARPARTGRDPHRGPNAGARGRRGEGDRLRITLAPDGGGDLAGTERYAGSLGATLKAQLEPLDPTQRRQAVESLLARTFHGIAVAEVSFEGEDDADAPLAIRWRGRSPEVARPVDGGLALEAGALPAHLAGRYLRIAVRTTPLLLQTTEQSSARIEIAAPAGMQVVAEPPSRVVTPFGAYERTDRAIAGGGMVRSERLEVPRARIDPGKYRDFSAFAAAVDALQEQPIRIAP